jgi:hypothetical protein
VGAPPLDGGELLGPGTAQPIATLVRSQSGSPARSRTRYRPPPRLDLGVGWARRGLEQQRCSMAASASFRECVKAGPGVGLEQQHCSQVASASFRGVCQRWACRTGSEQRAARVASLRSTREESTAGPYLSSEGTGRLLASAIHAVQSLRHWQMWFQLQGHSGAPRASGEDFLQSSCFVVAWWKR